MATSPTLNYPKYKLFPEFTPFLFKFAFVSILLFGVGSTLFAFRFLYFGGKSGEANMVSASTDVSTEKNIFVPPRGDAILETHIANNGMVFLKGARVVSVDGKTIKVASNWGEMNFVWVVKTNGTSSGGRDFGTQFYNNKGEKITVSDIRVGQFLQINGDIDTQNSTPTIIADVVRT